MLLNKNFLILSILVIMLMGAVIGQDSRSSTGGSGTAVGGRSFGGKGSKTSYGDDKESDKEGKKCKKEKKEKKPKKSKGKE